MNLKGKRILMFHVPNYGYHKVMIESFKKAGAEVDDFDSRPSHNFWTKALIRINRNLLGPIIDKYHNSIIEKVKGNNYDIVYCYKGEAFSPAMIQKLKDLFSKAYFVLYFPDSVRNNPSARQIIPLFDDCYTFDKDDTSEFGIKFLPLFYSDNMRAVANANVKKEFDLFFVGTVHSDRYNFIKKIVNQYEAKGLKAFTWFYFPSRVLYYKMIFENKEVRKAPKNEFKFKTIPAAQLAELLASSSVVLDIQHPKQTGLTMRTIETLGAKKKLITTNTQIKNYDFYNPSNILVVDRKNPVIPDEFMSTPYVDIPQEIYEKYYIDKWCETLLSNYKG